jgi:hypothetical protein
MEYDVIIAHSLDSVVNIVHIRIDENWIPQGGIAVMYDNGSALWAQAMIRKQPVQQISQVQQPIKVVKSDVEKN